MVVGKLGTHLRVDRRGLLAAALAATALPRPGRAQPAGFAAVRQRARGQTVWFHAWGGSPEVNAYLAWAAERLQADADVQLRHVKLTATAEAVARVRAEKAAGGNAGGAVDLIWINGANFAAMRSEGLLQPFAQALPAMALVDVAGKPTTVVDFGIPTEGYEAPWGMAQFVILHDAARLPDPPVRVNDLLDWAVQNPGRFTFPAPPDFVGTTFLKQAMLAYGAQPFELAQAPTPDVATRLTAPVWQALAAARPSLWRQGRTFPASKDALHQLLADAEVDLSMAFNPNEAAPLVAAGRLPPSVRTVAPVDGAIGNTHFLAIPFNAASPDAAMVMADFLLSPEAQARKQDPAVWGDPSVLDLQRLAPADRERFAVLTLPASVLPATAFPSPLLAEPHPGWVAVLEEGFARFAAG